MATANTISKKRLTEDEKLTIEQMYAEGKSAEVIGKAIWRAPQTVRNYLDAVGIKPIGGKSSKATGVNPFKCPHCGKREHQKGARFCYHCGHDIRSESVILAEKARKLLQTVAFLPDNMKVDTSDTIQAIIRYLDKQG